MKEASGTSTGKRSAMPSPRKRGVRTSQKKDLAGEGTEDTVVATTLDTEAEEPSADSLPTVAGQSNTNPLFVSMLLISSFDPQVHQALSILPAFSAISIRASLLGAIGCVLFNRLYLTVMETPFYQANFRPCLKRARSSGLWSRLAGG
jgi:hypothetical protein